MTNSKEASPNGTLSTEHTRRHTAPAGAGFTERLQGLIRKAEQDPAYRDRGQVASPASIVHYELLREVQRDQPTNQQKADFFRTISDAWHIVAFDQFNTRILKQFAAEHLYHTHQRALRANQPDAGVITLSPEQTTILDALADAVKLPNHQNGRQHIAIPPQFLRFDYQPE